MAMLRVTNLSDKPQTVVFDSAGGRTNYVIASGRQSVSPEQRGSLSLEVQNQPPGIRALLYAQHAVWIER